MNRRTFLRTGLYAPAGAVIAPRGLSAIADLNLQKEASFAPKIKISLNAFSFNSELRSHLAGEPGGLSLFELLEYCARVGFDAIDPTGYYFPGYPERPDRAYINKFKRRVHRLGLEISGTGIRTDFSNRDKAVREDGIQLTRLWLNVAAEMGAPVLRVFVGHQPDDVSWNDAAEWAVDCLGRCAEFGEKTGVIVAFQNHAHMIKNADQAIYILKQVNSEWLGLVADTGSFLSEDPYDDIARVIPYAVNWQLKDLLKSREGGPIDVRRFTRLLVAANYRGYVPIEALPGPDGREHFKPAEQVEKLYMDFRSSIDQLV